MARDSLRATLDELKLDEGAAKDRPYLEAMLRRLGYTETEIRAELGPPVEAPASAPAPALPDADEVAPAREYRLVIPAREAAFSFGPEGAAGGSDSPFEAFERVEFAPEPAAVAEPAAFDPAEEEAVEFIEEAAPVEETVEFEEIQPEPEMPVQEFQEEAPLQEFASAPVEELQPDEAAAVEDVQLDTFGADVDAQPRTRVRVKRVRARSKAEAEAKVAAENRRVIKSIPVDIVERWGGADAPAPKKKGDGA